MIALRLKYKSYGIKAYLTFNIFRRGYSQRIKYHGEMYKKLKSKLKLLDIHTNALKALWREVRYLRRWQDEITLPERSLAAVTIQRIWRGYCARKVLMHVKEEFKKYCELRKSSSHI